MLQGESLQIMPTIEEQAHKLVGQSTSYITSEELNSFVNTLQKLKQGLIKYKG